MDKLLEKALMNGCKSENIAKYALATGAHAKSNMLCMSTNAKEHSVFEMAIDKLGVSPDEIQDSEVLSVGFSCLIDRDDVIVFFIDSIGQAIMAFDNQYEYEYICAMSIPNFFKYLSTVPNPYLFADTSKEMLNATPLGIQLLSELAQAN